MYRLEVFVVKKIVALFIALVVAVSSIPAVFAVEGAYGDVNGNGKVDITDVTTVQRCIAKIITLTDDEFLLADVDGDGKLSVMDCTTVQRYVAKAIEHFPVEEMATEPPTEESTQITTQQPDYDSQPSEMELEILRLVNIEREKEGLEPVEFAYDYYESAKIRSKEVSSIETFSHTRPDGRPWHSVYEDLDVPDFWQKGENLAIYFSSAEQVVEGWMNSPGHRANILHAEFDYLAVSVCETVEYPGYYAGVQLFIASWDQYDRYN